MCVCDVRLERVNVNVCLCKKRMSYVIPILPSPGQVDPNGTCVFLCVHSTDELAFASTLE